MYVMYVCNVCMYVWMYVCMHACMHACMYVVMLCCVVLCCIVLCFDGTANAAIDDGKSFIDTHWFNLVKSE